MQALSILFGAGFTVAVALALGGMLLGERGEWPLRFVSGAAILSTLVFLLCAADVAYTWVFLVLGAAICAKGLMGKRMRLPRLPEHHRILVFFFILYFVLYFFSAMAPESSPDGVTYHLGFVARYFREHGFHKITWNMYANLSEGMEMLFLFAFAFGRHSAASMVHFAFTVALAWQMFSYGRRNGFPVAAACAALLVFASPIVGIDGTSAYNDVAVAAIGFALFDLVQQADSDKSWRHVAAVGLTAGFCYAVKYTAWPAVVYAVALTLWKTRRIKPALIAALAASMVIAPWVAKNWIWLQNPVSPFYNRYFPNPYVTTAFEESYRKDLQTYDLTSRKQIPTAVTTSGSLGGLLGPVFLLSPIALLSLRRREGRQLLLAALVFGCNYFSNISPRFLIAPLPFVALSMALALSSVPWLMLGVVIVHAVISWPPYIPKYCAPNAWHLTKVPYREALRLKNQDEYLGSHVFDYGVEKMVERSTTPGATVFTYRPIPEAYTSRRILVNYESAFNMTLGQLVQQAYEPQQMPTWRLRFSFPRRELGGLRITQTNTADDLWNIHELRLYDRASELTRRAEWRLTAQPYPWTIQEAFDNSVITFWRCGETVKPGQFVRIDFNRTETADAVLIEAAPNQPGIRLKLEGLANGTWVPLADAPQISDAAPPLGLKRATMDELRRRGVDYILTFGDERETRDLREHPAQWGIREIAHFQETKLYQLP